MNTIDYTAKMKKLGPLPEDMRIFWVRDDLARIEAQTPYCLQCIREGREIVAALDDFAQIIGTTVKIVPDDDLEIAKALTRSAAVLVDAEKLLYSDDKLPVSGSSMDGKSRREADYVVTTGRDPYEAYVALTVLEKAAEVQILADALGGVKALPDRIASKLRRDYLRKYSKVGRERREVEFTTEDGTDEQLNDLNSATTDNLNVDPMEDEVSASQLLIDEFKERRNLVEYGNKLIARKLVQGTWGNLSVRIDDDLMLVTPSGLDYDSLAPEDMVLMDIENLAVTSLLDEDTSDAKNSLPGNKPTSEASLHAGIYKNRPDIGAIIHTHSKYCSVFAACQMPIDVMDEYLAEEVAGDLIYVADYAASGSEELAKNVTKALGGSALDSKNEFEVLMYGRRGCIMSNHGMVACAADLDTALEVAEAMEEAARKQINARISKLIDAK